MKTINQSYSALKKEVEDFSNEVLTQLHGKPEAESLYKGLSILFSPLCKNPEIMFVGINPGAGYYNSTGDKKRDFEPTETFEYLEAKDQYDYAIAANTRDVFEKSDLYHLLENCVKTNYYYFATTKADELYKLFPMLGDLMNSRFHQLAEKWTKEIIEMVQPKVIVCEGKKALDLVQRAFGVTATWDDAIGYCELPNQTFLVGYKRLYSNIQNKDEVIQFFKTEVAKRVSTKKL